MPHAVVSSSSSVPVIEAFSQPLKRLMRRTFHPFRTTDQGKLYLGEGQPVMVLPLFGEGPESTASLRQTLDDAGFRTYDWKMGVDKGPGHLGLERWLIGLEEQVIEVFESQWQPITLLGWSLSGIYAREVAKRTNPLVRQVITLGSPFNPVAHPRAASTLLKVLAGSDVRTLPAVGQRLRQRPPVPCTSIFTKSDPKVPWRMCMENECVISENVEVDAPDVRALAAHPKVLEVVTHRLAQPDDEWRAFNA
jgi:hypothetical protein